MVIANIYMYMNMYMNNTYIVYELNKNINKYQLLTNGSNKIRWLWVKISEWFILELIWFFYDLSQILQLSEFVWALHSLVLVVLNHFLLIDATDKTKINGNHHRIFFDVSLYPLSYFANNPFKQNLINNLCCLKQNLINNISE